jgi:tRNA (guanine37-N1)-methyltransferase
MYRLYVALVHYPVVNRRGEVIASALTNLDLHDIARAAKTYGVQAYFVVTPVDDQRVLAERIVAHWTTGPGAELVPDRRRALELVRVTVSVAEVIETITGIEGERPLVVATCARPQPAAIDCAALRTTIAGGRGCLLMFGTAWGLAPEAFAGADCVLAPIAGAADYNHLAVRSAAAIVLDRLVGGDYSGR